MQNTSEYIVKTIAPIFNKKGYVGTSLSDLTKATKLTKGALYCNFKNKEELAITSFKYNMSTALYPVFKLMSRETTSKDQLKVLLAYYKNFYDATKKNGGCPILSIGLDAKHNCPSLFKVIKKESTKLINGLAKIIQAGIDNAEFKKSVNSKKQARNIYAMIEGAVFMSFLYEDKNYLSDIMDTIDGIVDSMST